MPLGLWSGILLSVDRRKVAVTPPQASHHNVRQTVDRPSEQVIGIILITGFLMLIVGAFVAPSGAYTGPIEDRLVIIDDNQTQWILSKVFDGLAVVGASTGLVMLAVRRRRLGMGWLNTVAGVFGGGAGVIGLTYIYILVTDPGPLYDRDTPAPIVTLFVAVVAIALIGFGTDFVRSAYSKWVGLTSLTVGTLVLVAQAAIQTLQQGPEAAFGLASLIYLAILAIGVMMLRRRNPRRT